jgi:hypothetical protein
VHRQDEPLRPVPAGVTKPGAVLVIVAAELHVIEHDPRVRGD